MSINCAIISGNLTRDPELKTTASGTSILNFSVAVNDRILNGDQWEDKPNYIDCVMFGKRAEGVSRHLAKGSKVVCQGRLRWSQWQDRETGKNRSKVEVVVESLDFAGGRSDAKTTESVYDNDIPF